MADPTRTAPPTAPHPSPVARSRAAVGRFVYSRPVQWTVIGVILLNAVVLGLETSHDVMATAGDALHAIDRACLVVFIVEIALKLYAEGLRFFRSAWNVFDFLVVGVALVPGADSFAVLRALRTLRVLRLISVVPALRRVVDALVRALPGIASIAALLSIVFYVGAVMATMLFGRSFPEYYGDLGASLFSLFQVMTLDGWSTQVRMVAEVYPSAPAFFVPFVLVSALTVLNLFIAVIVDAMQSINEDEAAAHATGRPAPDAEGADAALDADDQLAALRHEVTALTTAIRDQQTLIAELAGGRARGGDGASRA